ncbi:peptide deformylase [Thalassotalea euphylliae]|uniref:Peptide deformylase n=1 Tax=Thalassotalea euphylliae TaxID=1655234 RepID=A0A3E0U3S6_9GAMM|nr:peptide deformylase [Thalassotalea euphylliae]REL31237.1 peptide deformylase [Thalassotalea euphylliae]REL33880.1 peptide deformylase [Thalassotalea euphylliae]
MTVLSVLRFPDERLRTKAEPVTQVNDEIRKIVDDMFETMYDENGVGLAATQVNIHQRIVVMDCSDDKSDPLTLINPEIINKSDETFINEEGCLSVPGCYAKVTRHEQVTVKALDRDGNEFTRDADELLSICIQHELDHLAGVLFVDYLSPLKRKRIQTKLEKEARLNAKA